MIEVFFSLFHYLFSLWFLRCTFFGFGYFLGDIVDFIFILLRSKRVEASTRSKLDSGPALQGTNPNCRRRISPILEIQSELTMREIKNLGSNLGSSRHFRKSDSSHLVHFEITILFLFIVIELQAMPALLKFCTSVNTTKKISP